MDPRPTAAGDDVSWAPPDALNDFVARQFGLKGERRNVIAACATGAYSIALAASWIEQGLCDVVLGGSVEPYPHPLIEAGFRQMGVISSDGTTRPFDQKRTGFTFGEGAGIIVLESAEHFRKRQKRTAADQNGGQPGRQPTRTAARGSCLEKGYHSPKFRSADSPVDRLSGRLPFSPPYAVLSGWAVGADAHSAVAFNSNGSRIASVIEKALSRGGISAGTVKHVNAHGTATRLNDWIETQALVKAFGPHAQSLMISATKSSTGHLLGAAGSVELIFTVLALGHQFVPPTAALETTDPECPLDYTPRRGHAAAFEHALSLSFGFGGPIGALVVSVP